MNDSYSKLIKIYDKYIFKQVLLTTIVAILLFTVVWIAPEMLLNTIKDVLAGDMTLKAGVLFLIYQLPLILAKAFPVGLLLGSLFTFDKMSKDSELTILRAVGMSFSRIIAPVIVLSLIITYLCFETGNRFVPYTATQTRNIRHDLGISQYIYTQKDKNDVPLKSVIVSRFIGKDLEDVIVLDFSPKQYADMHGLTAIYVGKTGHAYDDRWILNDVTLYEISNDGIFVEIDKKPHISILDGECAKDAYILMSYSTKKEREITNHDMYNYLKLLKRQKMDEEYRYIMNKYLQRFFHPFVCMLLAIMGCLLGFSKPREQRLVGFTIAIGSIFLYYITLPFFDLLAEKGVLPPIITAAFPPIAFMIAIYMFYKTKDL